MKKRVPVDKSVDEGDVRTYMQEGTYGHQKDEGVKHIPLQVSHN